MCLLLADSSSSGEQLFSVKYVYKLSFLLSLNNDYCGTNRIFF